ncbi:MAG: GNAT family N-acetyltransferase, partial [Pseudomonadota bacterium]
MKNAYTLPGSLETRRFKLRRVTLNDAPEIFTSYATDPVVTRYLSWKPHQTISDTESYIQSVDQEWRDGRGFVFVIRNFGDGGLIGVIHVHLSARGVSYGYVIKRDVWGQGCASEVLKHLVDHA